MQGVLPKGKRGLSKPILPKLYYASLLKLARWYVDGHRIMFYRL